MKSIRRMMRQLRAMFSGERADAEMERELAAHLLLLEDEMTRKGATPDEARRLARIKLGGVEQVRIMHREERGLPFAESLEADVRFGWRQLMKRKVTTTAAVLSLGLAMGSCVAAFRLVDALFLRPLPIAHAERLYVLSRQVIDQTGAPHNSDFWTYQDFVRMREVSKKAADLIAVSFTERDDLTYKTDEEIEKAYVQYVSGWMFSSFGLQPTLGRLLTQEDDRTPGAHPYAVISYDYWTRRFGQDPKVIGRTFRLGERVFEIVGVGPKEFTGIEPGTATEIFLPTMMHRWVTNDDASWHRTLALIAPGTAMEPLRAKLDAVSRGFETERSKGWTGMPPQQIAMILAAKLLMDPATAGVSALQSDYRHAMAWLGVLVFLVLLIACGNVANLMTALAASRAREMALRVAIGAGRLRLMQMVMVESAILGLMAAGVGSVFAWWAAPMVVDLISPASNPVRLALPADVRVFMLGLLLILTVILLFGLAPALRASAMQPTMALKGGEEPQAKRRSMYALVAAQTAFCFLVLFLAGLFAVTFHRLSSQSMGFEAKGLLLLETQAPHGQTPEAWAQMGEQLRAMPGVTDVAESRWPLLSTGAWNGSISVNGAPPSMTLGHFLPVSPGWIDTMKMHLLEGRAIAATDTFPGEAVVNERFVKDFFQGQDPLGKTFEKTGGGVQKLLCRVVGVVADSPYRDLREEMLPVAFVPYREVDDKGIVGKKSDGTFLVRTTASDPMAIAAELRRKVVAAGAGFRVSNVETQQELIDNQTVRERLLAMMGAFFAGVALMMAAVGLYGVLHYSVMQREREIGVRIALGATAGNIAQIVSARVFAMVLLGAAVGLTLGLASERFVASLLYGVKGTEMSMMTLPAVVLLSAVALAAAPAVMRAVRIDPAVMLRSE
jgi:putative ABC transport system permease protein